MFQAIRSFALSLFFSYFVDAWKEMQDCEANLTQC